MVDTFIERIVQKKPTLSDMAAVVAIGAAAFLISVAAIFFLQSIGLFIVVGAGYGGWWLASRRSLEYEYSFLNGEMDVDVIIARRSRKRILTVKAGDFELMAPAEASYSAEMNAPGLKRIEACSSMDSRELYFAIFHSEDRGKTVLFFEPSPKMAEAMRSCNPMKVRMRVAG